MFSGIFLLTGLVALFVILFVIVIAPSLMVRGVTKESEQRRIALKNEIRDTHAKIVFGLMILVSAYTAYQEFESSRDKQFTDRFTAAIQLLSTDNPVPRTGAVYALDRLGEDSPADQERVYEVLRTHIRSRAAFSVEPTVTSQDLNQRAPDIQAALTVLTRPSGPPLGACDKHMGRMRPYYLGDVDLRGAALGGADMQGFFLPRSRLRAYLVGANLRWAFLESAHLEEANLRDAQLEGAGMWNADLTNARLDRACLKGAKLYGVDFGGACVKNANFDSADLYDAKLSNVLGLSETQLSKAHSVGQLPLKPFPPCTGD